MSPWLLVTLILVKRRCNVTKSGESQRLSIGQPSTRPFPCATLNVNKRTESAAEHSVCHYYSLRQRLPNLYFTYAHIKMSPRSCLFSSSFFSISLYRLSPLFCFFLKIFLTTAYYLKCIRQRHRLFLPQHSRQQRLTTATRRRLHRCTLRHRLLIQWWCGKLHRQWCNQVGILLELYV